jgi:hypothetical protein
MDINRKNWNAGQQKLKRALAAGDRETAIDLFLSQHAMLHSGKMAKSGLWSFEDEVLGGLTDDQVRAIPPDGEHSIAWILFHLARIEDITMNMLVAGAGQLFTREGWAKKLKVDIIHSANKMSNADVAGLSARMDVRALKSYRSAVGRRTRQIIKKLGAEDFKKKVVPHRIQNVLDEGAVIPEAMEVINYWGSRTIAGLLLMPATRHNVLHLNEALRIKQILKT